MKLTLEGLKNRQGWEKAGIAIPSYDIAAAAAATKANPTWVHFGIGNIFRIFIAGIADQLLEKGLTEQGIICVETFDHEVVDKIYDPYNNLALGVTLHGDGTTNYQVLGSMAEAVKADYRNTAQWNRLKEIFCTPSLQLVSFTITEKGYALTKPDGSYFDFVQIDMEQGPKKATSAMAIVTAMLWERFVHNSAPLALVSMDNCSENGSRLQKSILCIAREWEKRGFVEEAFVAYLNSSGKITFPWTMIDKITPRPSEKVAKSLETLGVANMQPVITSKKTFIAPFVNAEKPQYLVVEDNFPNGRPALEAAGVYMTNRDTVNKAEKMKVTACLNPIHTALGPYGCLLGYQLFAEEIKDPDMFQLASRLGYTEGMDVAPDPGILSPKAFLDELMQDRFPNLYLGDTNQRLATDASQMLGIRFGITIQAHLKKYGNTDRLVAIPLAIAGWLRYLLGIDDAGNAFALAPDPMIPELQAHMQGIVFQKPDSVKEQLKWILSNKNLFFVDLYEAGLGKRIEEIFREEIAGPGAVRKTIRKYLTAEF